MTEMDTSPNETAPFQMDRIPVTPFNPAVGYYPRRTPPIRPLSSQPVQDRIGDALSARYSPF
ncbi:hypothetical protein Pme01_09960 [Planosporangium mesophilum]|uniref:Uncharacterized protein n=1 Tax=Planosporangium mesophilum TaxID=689768 RepID=A0A8J3T7R5_9ACTN|nr:hypothetical protein Pme01_09960 [Planosporangium mesophilum]